MADRRIAAPTLALAITLCACGDDSSTPAIDGTSTDASSTGEPDTSETTSTPDSTSQSSGGVAPDGSSGSSPSSDASSSGGDEPIPNRCGDGVVGEGEICFGAAIDLEATYDLGIVGVGARPGHFDDDGHLDLAVIGEVPDGGLSVRILLGDGTGGFVVSPSYPNLDNVYAFDSADFDGDGIDDLLIRGDTFAEPPDPAFLIALDHGEQGWSISDADHFDVQTSLLGAFDYDGDGNVDVATFSSEDDRGLKLYLGNGAGVVGALAHQVAPVGGGPSQGELELADVSFDGNPDVVIQNDGSSTFGYIYADAMGVPAAAYFPFMFTDGGTALADLDDNGSLDALVTRYQALAVLRNDGDGTFTSQVTYERPGQLGGIVVADFDQDDRIDVAFADHSSVFFWRGTGGFDFEDVAEVGLGSEFPRSNLRVGDFDGDLVPDVVVEGSGKAMLVLSEP